MNTRISKACQECRQRKIRCTGERPCKSCRVHETECIYRQLTRTRRSLVRPGGAGGPATSATRGPTPSERAETPKHQVSGHSRDEEIYHSVSATQSTARGGHVQLYYGASSNFAFLQQLHRSMLLEDGSEIATPGEVQEGGAGLDLFNQRTLFFGTIANNARRTIHGASKWDSLPPHLLQLFLDIFFKTFGHVLSFIQEEEIRVWSHSIFEKRTKQTIEVGQAAITLAVIALGAMCTEYVDWGEIFYKAAKTEADDFDEVVNLHSVQLSILLCVYQNAMGRPNQSYLHSGFATRKAFAMGLHKDIYSGNQSTSADSDVRQRRTTIWCLYFHERWQAFSLGRLSSIRRSDITCPIPETDTFLTQSVRLLDAASQGAEMMYGHRRLSLWETWKAAESVHSELRRFAEDAGLAFASRHHETSHMPMHVITLTCFYYHTILITFRPFLIVASARQRQRRLTADTPGSTPGISLSGDEMWLREACRYAVDSARDQISFLITSIRETEICKRLKYNGFFIESCCAVLLYDSLMHKHTYAHNLEYIKAGLQCLESMKEVVPGEPVATAAASVKQILLVAQRKLSGQQMAPTENIKQPSQSTPPSHTEGPGPGQPTTLPTSQPAPPNPAMSGLPDLDAWGQELPQLDWSFDVFTTDLNRYFPLDDSYGSETAMGTNVESEVDQDVYREPYY